MKKNLFLAMGVLAVCGLIACGKGEENKNGKDGASDTNSDSSTEVSDKSLCSALTAADFAENACIRCTIDGSDETELVCGLCTAADAATDSANFYKNVCATSVEGAKAFAQTLVCDEIVENVYMYYEYKSTTCKDNELCKDGFCEIDESIVTDPCYTPTYSCDGETVVATPADGCTDLDTFAVNYPDFDCSELGGCVAAEGTCLAFVTDGTCTKYVNKVGVCEKSVTGVITATNYFIDPDCDDESLVVKCSADCSTDENDVAVCDSIN